MIMNYKKMLLDMGISLDILTDLQLGVLQKAVAKETEDRKKLYYERLAKEYADKLTDLINGISDEGLVVYYCGSPIDIQKVGEQLVVGCKDD